MLSCLFCNYSWEVGWGWGSESTTDHNTCAQHHYTVSSYRPQHTIPYQMAMSDKVGCASVQHKTKRQSAGRPAGPGRKRPARWGPWAHRAQWVHGALWAHGPRRAPWANKAAWAQWEPWGRPIGHSIGPPQPFVCTSVLPRGITIVSQRRFPGHCQMINVQSNTTIMHLSVFSMSTGLW